MCRTSRPQWCGPTKSGTIAPMLRQPLTNFVTFAALVLPEVVGAHPLEDAVRDALTKCQVIEAASLDRCGGSQIRSPEASAARRSVARAYAERNAFIQTCERFNDTRCSDQAEWHIGAGMSRVLNTPVVRLP